MIQAKPTLMIVEDLLSLQQRLKRSFAKEGYRVLCARTGDEALLKLTQAQPQLIILDSELPNSQSNEVCKALKSNHSYRSIPLMVLTSKGRKAGKVDLALDADLYANRKDSLHDLKKQACALMELGLKSSRLDDNSKNEKIQKRIKVLFADPNLKHLKKIKKELEKKNYDVMTVTSGVECLESLERWTPDILLLNHEMPEIHGNHLCRLIRFSHEHKDIPILMLVDKSFKRKRSQLGANDYILQTEATSLIDQQIQRQFKRMRGVHQGTHSNSALREKDKIINRLREELLKKEEELRKLEDLKSEFVGTISHELRTPLTIVKESVSQIHEGLLGEINEEQKMFLNIALEGIECLAKLIEDLLDISKIETGKIDLSRELVDIVAVVRKNVLSFENEAREKGIKLEMELPSRTLETYFDSEKIGRVIKNLLHNALKFTDLGFVRVVVRDAKDSVVCSVVDSGKGIAAEDMPRLFEKFEQLQRTVGPGERGTGLGLAIAKKIVSLHEGQITVQSKAGQGASFTFTIPKWKVKDFLSKCLELGVQQAIRQSRCFSVIAIRIKDFDEVLRNIKKEQLDKLLQGFIYLLEQGLRRKGDRVIQDGKAFYVLLPETEKENALMVAGRFIHLLEEAVSKENLQGKIQFACDTINFPKDAKSMDELVRLIT